MRRMQQQLVHVADTSWRTQKQPDSKMERLSPDEYDSL
jgi:hypothetical protein